MAMAAKKGKVENDLIKEGYSPAGAAPQSLMQRILTNTDCLFVITLGTWLLIGMLVYVYSNKWTWYNAFFYCINAGLSIGYGEIAENTTQQMHAFTIAYVLCGSSIISGSFGYFLSSHLSPAGGNLTPDDLHVYDTVTMEQGFYKCMWYRFKLYIGK